MDIRFATYNIQYGVGQDGRYDLSRAAAALGDEDVVCLQEVTTGFPVCNFENQPAMLADALGFFAAYAPGFEVGDGNAGTGASSLLNRARFGNMVLSRWPIVYSRHHSLPRPATEVALRTMPKVDFPRAALETVLDIDGTPLRVVSVHLSHLPGGQRLPQIRALRSMLHALPDEALLWENDPRMLSLTGGREAPANPASTMVFGDFNFEPGDDDYRAMVEPAEGQIALADAWETSDERLSDPRTCLGDDGRLLRIDYLFLTADLAGRVRSATVDQADKSSDHYPVRFVVDLPAA